MMSSSMIERVREFFEKYGRPKDLNLDHLSRVHCPTLEAIGQGLSAIVGKHQADANRLFEEGDPRAFHALLVVGELHEWVEAVIQGSLFQAMDASGDLLYINLGLFVLFGLPMEEIFDEIHRSNMTKKVGSDVRMKDKGEQYEEPSMALAAMNSQYLCTSCHCSCKVSIVKKMNNQDSALFGYTLAWECPQCGAKIHRGFVPVNVASPFYKEVIETLLARMPKTPLEKVIGRLASKFSVPELAEIQRALEEEGVGL